MELLHKDREEFDTILSLTNKTTGIDPEIIEKDYYVTKILQGLNERLDYIVFKGGTSLSKCYKVINRFSEDIDITIDMDLTWGQMRKIKKVISEVIEQLGLKITNLEQIRSRRNYNKYLIAYDSVLKTVSESLKPVVILETSYAEISFPIVQLPVDSYIGEFLREKAPEYLEEYGLLPFTMKIQGLDRTLIDKVFAICDYYMKKMTRRYSRHLYDIYKLLPLVPLDDDFRKLVKEVREIRAKNVKLCPSAQPGVNVTEILYDIINNEIYRNDFETVTCRILNEQISYDVCISAIKVNTMSNMFEE